MRPRRAALAYLGLAVADTWLSGSDHPLAHRVRPVTKSLLMPTLATATAAAGGPPSLLAAQAGSWVGDLALLGEDERAFRRGIAGFTGAHLAYVAGMRRHQRPEPMRRRASGRILGGVWLLSGPALAWAAGREDRGLGAAVGGYSAALVGTAASAVGLDRSLPRSVRVLTGVGGLSFLVSDTILGVRRFLLTDPPPATERAVMGSYTLAQGLLAAGLVLANRAGRTTGRRRREVDTAP